MGAKTAEMRHIPRKQSGQARMLRTINGAALDVRGGAAFIGATEKAARGMIERHTIPFRRMGGRIIFIKAELEAWLANLPGCTAEEARENSRVRKGLEGC